MTDITTQMCIGVDNYVVTLNTPCTTTANQPSQITLSFALWGHFLPAAVNDDLKKTIDYDALCVRIKNSLMHHDCHSFENIQHTILDQIRSCSSLITHGSLWIALNCHHAFRCEINLLESCPKGLNQ